MTNTILVCGSRDWNDKEAIRRALSGLDNDKDTLIIHGDCEGADKLAGVVAKNLGLKVEAYPADWDKHGSAAGPIRNQQMLDEGKPDRVYAFHDDWKNSKGTKDMIMKATQAEVPVFLFDV